MKKFMTAMACFTLALLGAVGLVACGKKTPQTPPSPVSFGVTGYFMDANVNVKPYTWDKGTVSAEDAAKGIVETYTLREGQEIEEVTFGEGFTQNNGKIVAICINAKGHDNVKYGYVNLKTPDGNPEAFEGTKETTENGEEVNGNRLTLFIHITAQTKGGVIYVDWDGDGEGEYGDGKYDEAYKFVIDGSKFVEAV